jgi:hypothetical protein
VPSTAAAWVRHRDPTRREVENSFFELDRHNREPYLLAHGRTERICVRRLPAGDHADDQLVQIDEGRPWVVLALEPVVDGVDEVGPAVVAGRLHPVVKGEREPVLGRQVDVCAASSVARASPSRSRPRDGFGLRTASRSACCGIPSVREAERSASWSAAVGSFALGPLEMREVRERPLDVQVDHPERGARGRDVVVDAG